MNFCRVWIDELQTKKDCSERWKENPQDPLVRKSKEQNISRKERSIASTFTERSNKTKPKQNSHGINIRTCLMALFRAFPRSQGVGADGTGVICQREGRYQEKKLRSYLEEVKAKRKTAQWLEGMLVI